MTIEIVIMNKEAIALAADSAATISQEKGQKIFPSANKLFALSKYYPVGIMIYGNASFMGIPWESIIKIYRNKLGKRKFDTLKQYAYKFIAFLDNGNPLFPETEQKKYLSESTLSYFNLIRENIEKNVNSIREKKGEITDNQVKQITSDVIKEHFGKCEKAKMLQSTSKNPIENIINKYGNIIDEVREKVFEKLPISNDSLKQLIIIAASLFSKDIFPARISGVVIAGFGEKDIFPSFKSFDIEGIVNDKLKYKEQISWEINFENTSAIYAFAESEMVSTFLYGIDPDLQNEIDDSLHKIFVKYPEAIIENIEKNDDSEKQRLKQKLKEVSNQIFKDYQGSMKTYIRVKYVRPVMGVVGMLPKDELAVMAESLVSLTLFKRKVTMEKTETVGGPIDVAIISKGDGFIWIKRKHYFKAELNPQFFYNYYREAKNGKKSKGKASVQVDERV